MSNLISVNLQAERYQKEFYDSQCYSLPDILYIYLSHVYPHLCLNRYVLYILSGLSFSNIIPFEESAKAQDITCMPSEFLQPVQSLMQYLGMGSACELIQKLGGVYNREHYVRRIKENLNRGKPVIARGLCGNEFWNLIIRMDNGSDSLLLHSSCKGEGVLVSEWFDKIEEILIIGEPHIENDFNCKQIQAASTVYSMYAIGSYYVGCQAHNHICRLLPVCAPLSPITNMIMNYFKRVFADRYRIIQFISSWTPEREPNSQALDYIKKIYKICAAYCELINGLSGGTQATDKFVEILERLIQWEKEIFII